jgi:lysine 2,3-aminomutase
VLRNFEGLIGTYEQPAPGAYQSHDSRNCEYCQSKRPEPGQEGVTHLLDGRQMTIKPEGFDATHVRGNGAKHRLNADESKWQPFGIGSETQPYIAVGERVPVVNGEEL